MYNINIFLLTCTKIDTLKIYTRILYSCKEIIREKVSFGLQKCIFYGSMYANFSVKVEIEKVNFLWLAAQQKLLEATQIPSTYIGKTWIFSLLIYKFLSFNVSKISATRANITQILIFSSNYSNECCISVETSLKHFRSYRNN